MSDASRNAREPLRYEIDCWIKREDAPAEYGRTERTIRQWVKDGKVRTMRPRFQLWLYRPDLAACEAASANRRRPR